MGAFHKENGGADFNLKPVWQFFTLSTTINVQSHVTWYLTNMTHLSLQCFPFIKYFDLPSGRVCNIMEYFYTAMGIAKTGYKLNL